MPESSQTLVRLRPNFPICTLLRCESLPWRKTNTSSWRERYSRTTVHPCRVANSGPSLLVVAEKLLLPHQTVTHVADRIVRYRLKPIISATSKSDPQLILL